MVERRTRALIELITSTLLLAAYIGQWKFLFDHADEMDEVEAYPVSPTALTTGAVSGAIRSWLSDHDAYGIRTSRRRRILYNLLSWCVRKTLIKRYAPSPDAFVYNFGLGAAIGRIVYRLWYGLLHPLPGADD